MIRPSRLLNRLTVLCLFFVAIGSIPSQSKSLDSPLDWQTWSNDVFVTAKRLNRFILLDLEAIWCHWCHVMDEKTYQDDQVVRLLKQNYITVKVNQDSRPDLANRYRDYGWPATIIFAPDGTEIVKRAGYISPESMARLLQAIIDDPSPERTNNLKINREALASSLSDELLQKLLMAHQSSQDLNLGGLNINQKYVERDSVEYALLLAKENQDQKQLDWANLTLTQGLKLFDPAFGGVYQYSTKGDWNYPHFEKLTAIQASYLRLYALAFAQTQKADYQQAVESIINYSQEFLLDSDGAFYTSQDADLIPGQHSAAYYQLNREKRLELGIPKIDQQRYTKENGMMIEALATAYEVFGNEQWLTMALASTDWIIQHRQLKNSGFSHGEKDIAGPYLADNLAMARAFLQLYRVSAQRKWLTYAQKTALFINDHFRHEQGGFVTSQADGSPILPIRQIDENISLTRFSNLLFQYLGDKTFQSMAEHAFGFLAIPSVALSRGIESGILQADHELAQAPLHFTVKGSKEDKAASQLFKAALLIPAWYKRVEWWDEKEGALPNPDVSYPPVKQAAIFICTNKLCSLPIYDSVALNTQLARMQALAQ